MGGLGTKNRLRAVPAGAHVNLREEPRLEVGVATTKDVGQSNTLIQRPAVGAGEYKQVRDAGRDGFGYVRMATLTQKTA